jgi:hypothetical protein
MSVASLFWLTVQVAMFSVVGAGIFLLLRRRGPSTAAACAATVLMLTLPLLMISLSPWPRWEIAAKREGMADRVQPAEPVQPNNLAPDNLAAVEIVNFPAQEAPQESAVVALWRKAGELLQTPEQPAENATVVGPAVWRTWLPWVMAAGVMIGVVRLLIGIWAVRGYRECSTLVDDEQLLQLVRNVEQQLVAPKVLLTLRREESCGRDSAVGENLSQRQRPAASSITAEREAYTQVEVRETPRLRSAATIGWRRPILLLPADWQTWTETERRVVIAHELAHVARRDYLLVLIARFATAVHFYQPLVLWLARQLRVQQELAADAWAADITGSRQTYLTTLAQMALRADEQTVPWAARAFLPGTGLLVKRVTWLKRNKSQEEQTMKRRSRWILGVTMAAVALFVAGIRGPNESASMAKAAEPSSAETHKAVERGLKFLRHNPQDAGASGATDKIFAQAVGEGSTRTDKLEVAGMLDFATVRNYRTTEFIPGDAGIVTAVCPNQFAKFPQIAKFFDFVNKDARFEREFGIAMHDLDDVIWVMTDADEGMERMIFRSTKVHDWKKLFESKLNTKAQAVQIGDKTYYTAERAQFGALHCAYFPDDRTMVMASEREMKKILSGADKKLEGAFVEAMQTSRAFLKADVAFLRKAMRLDRPKDDPFTAAILPVFDKAKEVMLTADIGTQMAEPQEFGYLSLTASCASAEAAKEVGNIANAVRTLGLNVTAMQDKHYSEMVARTPGDKRQMVEITAKLWKLATEALKNAQVNPADKSVSAVSRFPLPPDIVDAMLLPAVGAAREAAMRNQSMNNMKQLALGLHNYASAYKRFPAAAGAKGNSKHKHSWRVAILPFVDEGDLYNQYHFDEPWDSEHNKQLIDKMPAVFRDTHATKDSTSSSYYMVTGKGTFGDSEKGRMMKEITDGLSKTIMLVDAKRDIPWTKPEDIEIDADAAKPLPKFGGFLEPEGLFVAALADGSVQLIAGEADPKLLRSLFTVGGGESVDFPNVEPQPTERKPLGESKSEHNKTEGDRRKANVENLKKIGLALHNYVAAKKRFPPSIIVGKDGKTTHSWRVEILPYLEEQTVYNEYRFDEPWDSEHNRKLIAKIPDAFRHPLAATDDTNATYFMVTGAGNFGGVADGLRPKNITDGMSKTIMIVEAKRDIPWTKPDDIEVVAGKELPKFGGFISNGAFLATFADGSVRPIVGDPSPEVMRAFLTYAGGEVANYEALWPPASASSQQ